MNYAVRQIKEADFLEYYDCLGRVAREKKYLAFQDAPPIEGAISWVESHIKQNHPLHVVQFRNRVVGWCDVTPSPREVFAHCGELGMGLVKEFRGRGLGKLLIDSVLEHSISIGVERIELDVRTDNVNAISLYEKTGFVREGRKRNAYKNSDGDYLDILIYGLILNTVSIRQGLTSTESKKADLAS